LREKCVLGIDPGIRGGAGLAVIGLESGDLIYSAQVGRDPGFSTIQMMRAVRDAVFQILCDRSIAVVAREDHVFPQAIERIARNILRRMNGVIDVCVCDREYVEGENYFGFPVGTWKVLSGLPGDLGKETKAAQKGETVHLGTRKKKGTPEQYLAAINALLKTQHKTVDEADAHAIANAARTVALVRRGVLRLTDVAPRVAESLWDKERTGATIRKAIREMPEFLANPAGDLPRLRTYLRDFAL
jgi:Holliday junction resolvasome RuvABC endonuclease subunit